MKTEIPLGTKRHSITAWQQSWGDKPWHYVIVAYRRDRFKRSGRVGWRKLGFASSSMESKSFPDRKAAIAAAREEIKLLS